MYRTLHAVSWYMQCLSNNCQWVPCDVFVGRPNIQLPVEYFSLDIYWGIRAVIVSFTRRDVGWNWLCRWFQTLNLSFTFYNLLLVVRKVWVKDGRQKLKLFVSLPLPSFAISVNITIAIHSELTHVTSQDSPCSTSEAHYLPQTWHCLSTFYLAYGELFKNVYMCREYVVWPKE